jgi:hypothetical protein
VGKPNEREIYYSTSGKYISTTITQFLPREKILHNTKTVLKFASIFVPRKSVQRYRFSLSSTSKSVPKSMLYGHQQNYPLLQHKTLKWLPRNPCNKMPRNLCSKLPRFSSPPSLLYGLYGSVQYGLSNIIKFSTHKK